MMAPPATGIPAVDAELKRREFTNANEAEAMAAKLFAVWRTLQPSEVVLDEPSQQRRR
jgi:hypothetical protein